MSSLPLLLLVLLLSLSSYSCNARHLGVVHDASGKELEKGSLERASIPVKPVQQGEQEKPLNVKDGTDERSLGATTEDRSESEALSRDVKGTRGVVSGLVQTKSLAKVSWRIPHEKHKEHLGFNLDYSPPKIHPPSHN